MRRYPCWRWLSLLGFCYWQLVLFFDLSGYEPLAVATGLIAVLQVGYAIYGAIDSEIEPKPMNPLEGTVAAIVVELTAD